MRKFSFEMEIQRKITVEANSLEEARKLAKEVFIETSNKTWINTISHKDETEWEDIVANSREEVIDYVDENIDNAADSHLEVWSQRYLGYSKSEAIYDLKYIHDPSLEIGECEDEVGFELNDFEREFLKQSFIEAVIEQLF